MLKGRAGYYLVIVMFAVAAAWIGYFLAQVIRSNAFNRTSIIWMSLIAAAVMMGVGFAYFSNKRRHGEQDIPCNIEDTKNIKVGSYHLIMATSRAKREEGLASVKSTDMVNGIALEPVNKDNLPHRIRIEVAVNGEFEGGAVKDMVINAGAAVPVAMPFPKMMRLAHIESVDIRISQV